MVRFSFSDSGVFSDSGLPFHGCAAAKGLAEGPAETGVVKIKSLEGRAGINYARG
jgi:hypothetical protein